MANDFYNHSGFPSLNEFGDSASARAEFDAINAGFNKFPALSTNALKVLRVNATGLAVEAVDPGSTIDAATAKTVPVGADEVPIADSAAAFVQKKVTLTNWWAATFTALGPLVNSATSKATPVAADSMLIQDSAATNATKQLTVGNLFTNYGNATVFTSIGPALNAATSKATPVAADSFLIQDSAATNVTKQLTLANLVTNYLSLLSTTWALSISGTAATATTLTTTIDSAVVGTTQAIGDNSTKIATTAYADRRPVLATPQASTSGTAITFASIPAWVKRITLSWKGVGTSGTSNKLIQIGSGSVINTGYVSQGMSSSGAAVGNTTSTAGFSVGSVTAADRLYGVAVLALESSTNNTWNIQGSVTSGGNIYLFSGGLASLAGALDRVVFTTANGTDTFVAGELNIMYE